jgi:hypothetical protein
MNLSMIFAVLIGFGSLFVSLRHVRTRMKEIEDNVRRANSRRKAQVERIKRAARGTLKLARDLRELKRRKFVFEMACHDLETQLSASKLLDKRIYVVEERRNEAELCFLARVANPDYAAKVNPKLMRNSLESWRQGRRFIVWAPDEKKAQERLVARFPDMRGYRILSLEPYSLDFL